MNTAGRRQRQARGGYRHMSPQDRPHYKVRDSATAARRLREEQERRRYLQARGYKF